MNVNLPQTSNYLFIYEYVPLMNSYQAFTTEGLWTT